MKFSKKSITKNVLHYVSSQITIIYLLNIFLAINLFNFIILPRKLDNPYNHEI